MDGQQERGSKPQPQSVSIKEVAECLGVSEISVKRWCNEGRIPSVKISNKRLIGRKWLETTLETMNPTRSGES